MPWRRFAASASDDARKESNAAAAAGQFDALHTAAAKTVVTWISGGRSPMTSTPGRCINSLNCWKQSSTSPRATSVPTGTPGGACTIRGAIKSAMPQRLNKRTRCSPLGPVEYPILRARRTASRIADSLETSGCVAPAATAIATRGTSEIGSTVRVHAAAGGQLLDRIRRPARRSRTLPHLGRGGPRQRHRPKQ